MDVKDCINAYNYVCNNSKKYLKINDSKSIKKIVMGGSHGGFLTGHLIGQYPDIFMCASSRNPVLNLLAMFGLTDIPDWILCECGVNRKYDDTQCSNLKIINHQRNGHYKFN